LCLAHGDLASSQPETFFSRIELSVFDERLTYRFPLLSFLTLIALGGFRP
jgi:hypothetical protein